MPVTAMMTPAASLHSDGLPRPADGTQSGRAIAPNFPDAPDLEPGVIRIPAVQRFAGSDFSVPIPVSRPLREELDEFGPDIVQSHHPFLLGDTALRVSASRELPVIFAYHTRYEMYGHHFEQDSELLKRLVLSLAIGCCNLCDCVIAPSESIARHLANNRVTTPVKVIPTGVDPARFAGSDGGSARRALGIADDASVIGHIGRLAPEKNPSFLSAAVDSLLGGHPSAHLIVAGAGPARSIKERDFAQAELADRVHFAGVLTGASLADFYSAMDVFAFSSRSETQGLVLAEAMTAGVPVVAVDAPGAREVVRDGDNGRLLAGNADDGAFAQALGDIANQDGRKSAQTRKAAPVTARLFSADRCIERTIELYKHLCGTGAARGPAAGSAWQTAMRSIAPELDIIGNIASAVSDAVLVANVAGE